MQRHGDRHRPSLRAAHEYDFDFAQSDDSGGSQTLTPTASAAGNRSGQFNTDLSSGSDWGAESVDGGEKLQRYVQRNLLRRLGGGMTSKSRGKSVHRGRSVRTRTMTSPSDSMASSPGGHGNTTISGPTAYDEDGTTVCCGCCPKPQITIPHALRHRALFLCLRGANPLRLFVYNLVQHNAFESLVMLVIAANCVLLAMDDPLKSDAEQTDWRRFTDFGLAVFYSVEMMLKWVALGFVLHRGSYLRDPWNRLDMLIVLLTWLSLVPGIGNYSGLRVLRVLRPLRSMNAVKGLKVLVMALLQSFKSLWPVLTLGAIVFSIFAVVATQLWSGAFRNVCVPVFLANATSVPGATSYELAVPRQASSMYTLRCDPESTDYGSLLGTACPRGYECRGHEVNPGLGYVNFDHTGYALLTIFEVVTFESWPAALRATIQVSGQPVIAFYIMVILIGSYFIPNLALAVINDRYHAAIQKQRRDDEAEKRAQDDAHSVARGVAPPLLGLKSVLSSEPFRSSRGPGHMPVRAQTTTRIAMSVMPAGSPASPASPISPYGSANMRPTGSPRRTDVMFSDQDEMETRSAMELTAVEERPMGPGCWLRFRNVLHTMTQGVPLPEYALEMAYASGTGASSLQRLNSGSLFGDASMSDFPPNGTSSSTRSPLRKRNTVFTLFIILCIVLNTVVLAAQHHNQPLWMDSATEIANRVFLAVFGVELIIVLTAIGFRRFFTSGFHLLDLFVVLFSIIEQFLIGSSFITVFRALRLLRVLKLIRNAPSLQAVVRVMLSALKEAVYLTIVLFLVILMFALAGMQFFGGSLRKLETVVGDGSAGQRPIEVRAHFDTFLNAFYTVFQVITTDNWTDLMWTAMRATSPWAALYFIALILVGFYVMINLFLSILIQGFEREARRTHHDTAGYDEDLDEEEDVLRREDLGDVQRKIAAKLHDDEPDAQVTVLYATKREARDREAKARRAKLEPVLQQLQSDFGQVPETALALALLADRNSMESMVEAMPLSDFTCARCKYRKQKVLSAPPFVAHRSVHELHEQHCWLAEHRRTREEYLLNLHAIVHQQMQENSMLTQEMSHALLINSQKCGVFANLKENSLRSWRDIREEAQEELDVVRLAVGEEQLGRAHVSYVYQGTKLRHATNGNTSLFVFGPENAFRVWLTSIIQHPAFDVFTLLLIALSTILLIVDGPKSNFDGTTRHALDWTDFGFNCAFAVEIVMRVIATGLFMHPGSYLRSGWHWLDLVSVVVSFAASFSAIRALRILRFMRALRSIKRYRGLRIVVVTIIASVKGIIHVVILSGLNYLIFGIFAVQLLAGKLYECNDTNVRTMAACVGNFTATAFLPSYEPGTNYLVPTTFEVPRRWEKFTRNFDHIGSALLTLFQVSTGDDWADVMYSSMDAKSVTEAPERDYQPLMGLFFVAFFIVSNFFFLSVFIGVVIVNFSKVKEKIDGLFFLTEEQRTWVDSQRAILHMRPEPLLLRPGAGSFRRHLDAFVRGATFELAIAACIALNVIAVAMEFPDQPDNYAVVLKYVNWSFAGVFFLEMLLKLVAHGHRYFFLGWNRFDGFLAVLGIVTAVLEILSSESGDYLPIRVSVLRTLRFVRVLRVIRLFKKARKVRVLVETLWYSLPSIANISLLLMIVYLAFAVIGVQLFSGVRSGGRFVDDQFYNFENFFSALQLMFIFTTNEKWSDAMYDMMEEAPYCSEAAGDCGIFYAPLFFGPFVVIAAFVVSNLFLAIILDNFQTTMKLDQSRVTLSDLHRFLEVWALFDPDSTRRIPTKMLPRLLASLQPPLGTTRAHSRVELLRRMAQYRILDHAGEVHFAEVVVPLARQATAEATDALLGYELSTADFPELDELPTVWFNHKPAHVGHTMAATYVAACYRRHRLRTKFLEHLEARKKYRRRTTGMPISQTRKPSLNVEDY
jgi:hypothetical protein